MEEIELLKNETKTVVQEVEANQNDLVININNGAIRGQQSQTIGENKTYYSFRKIPFAKPPIGDLRFEPPEPIDNWTDILDATADGECSIQADGENVIGSENCLFVNVYTPQLPGEDGSVSLPVMVWFYGGGFAAGMSKYILNGPDFLLDKGVVFVSFNYRLGIFGFLSTGDTVVPGNTGLKDQVLALKWIKANIQHFGGDPDKITIFGQSAGSASVSYQLQSPLSKGLFNQAIMESGSSLCPWALSRKAKKAREIVAKELNISFKNSQELVECLKKVSADDLQKAAGKASKKLTISGNILEGTFVFAPVIEPDHRDAFFCSKSHESLTGGNFHKVPTIIGFNSMETLMDNISLPMRIFLSKYGFNQTLLVPPLNAQKTCDRLSAGCAIKCHYFGLSPVSCCRARTLNKFISESTFNRPISEMARIMSQYTTVYTYIFDFEGNVKNGKLRTGEGSSHCEELAYLFRIDPSFPIEKFPTNPTETELLIRRRMTTLWTNFAKYGNPTPNRDPQLDNFIWDQTNPETLNYLHITDRLTSKIMKQQEFWIFWQEQYEKYGNPPYATY